MAIKSSFSFILAGLLLGLGWYSQVTATQKCETNGTIFLIRHAETRANALEGTPWDRSCAQANHSITHLSDRGYEQAKELADFFSDIPIDFVFTTEMFRTHETVEPLVERQHEKGRKPVFKAEPLINNIRLGPYECLNGTVPPLGKAFWDRLDNDPAFHAPDGESQADVRRRIEKFLKQVTEGRKYRSKNVILVGHSRTLPALQGYFLGATVPEQKLLKARNAEVYRVTCPDDGEYLVERRVPASTGNWGWEKVMLSR
ncbi:MAG: histidine phosphatase family protein [Pseudomonadota bacterium]